MKYISGVALALILISCDESSKESIDINDEILGSWILSCHNSTSAVYEFGDIEYSGDIVTYAGQGCAGDVVSESSFSGIYSIGDQLNLDDGNVAYEIDFNVTINGTTLDTLNIVYLDENKMFFGIGPENARPTKIDFSFFLVKI